jgi:hypothetical protein
MLLENLKYHIEKPCYVWVHTFESCYVSIHKRVTVLCMFFVLFSHLASVTLFFTSSSSPLRIHFILCQGRVELFCICDMNFLSEVPESTIQDKIISTENRNVLGCCCLLFYVI